jgi:hypothetical protein
VGDGVVGAGRVGFAAGGVSGDWSYRRVLAVTLINYLFEEESTEREDGNDRPDFKGGFALRSTDVGRRFVGARGVTWLAAVEAGGAGAEMASSCGQNKASLEQCAW